tara:strand:+ start:169 stop:801 length:633 start_codon:yes stop_codon:yes gene_type:complete
MALKGKQKNIDANKDGRISAEDFEIMRSRQRGGMKKKMMGGGLTAATQKLKSQGKMGGGMMVKPLMMNKGDLGEAKNYKKYLRGLERVTSKTRFDKAVARRKALEARLKNEPFLQRRISLGNLKSLLPGRMKFLVPAGIAIGVAASKGADKMREKLKEMKKNKKMGGGMMMKPMMKMGGGMMNMPGYKKGKSVMAKGCKLGRKKPTKMYT